MDKQAFITLCQSQLIMVYQLTKAGKPDDKMKHRVEGFMYAGQVMGLLSEQECQQLLEDTHVQVFGQTIDQRQARKDSLEKLKRENPKAYFAIPAIERQV